MIANNYEEFKEKFNEYHKEKSIDQKIVLIMEIQQNFDLKDRWNEEDRKKMEWYEELKIELMEELYGRK